MVETQRSPVSVQTPAASWHPLSFVLRPDSATVTHACQPFPLMHVANCPCMGLSSRSHSLQP